MRSFGFAQDDISNTQDDISNTQEESTAVPR
jgi:hypothetical protein